MLQQRNMFSSVEWDCCIRVFFFKKHAKSSEINLKKFVLNILNFTTKYFFIKKNPFKSFQTLRLVINNDFFYGKLMLNNCRIPVEKYVLFYQKFIGLKENLLLLHKPNVFLTTSVLHWLCLTFRNSSSLTFFFLKTRVTLFFSWLLLRLFVCKL